MKIEMKKKSAEFCRECFRQTKLIQERAECIVPDVLEDVGQIASAEAQICLKSKDLVEHGVEIGALAEISVFYITESRERVRCVRITKAFETGFECPALASDAEAQISLVCQGVQARAVNPRKIAVQLSVRADLGCRTRDCLEIPCAPEEETDGSLQIKQENLESLMTVQLGEKSFVVSEQLPLDAGEETSAIACARAELLKTDTQIIGSKALIKGGVQLRIGYETENGMLPHFVESCLPFSVLVDLPDEECKVGLVIFTPTALYAELSDAINGSRVIELELHAVAQVAFEKSMTIDYLSDAYSTRCPVIAEEGTATICRGRRKERLHASATERIPAESERGFVAASSAEILSYSAKEDRAAVSAAVSLLLRAEDGTYSAMQRLLSMETEMPEAGGEILSARIGELAAERQGEEIVVMASCEIDCGFEEQSEIHYLSALETDEESAFDPASLPSVTMVKKAGRELWEIAKLYRSSEGAISKMGEKYALPGDLLLIPRI